MRRKGSKTKERRESQEKEDKSLGEKNRREPAGTNEEGRKLVPCRPVRRTAAHGRSDGAS
jgi:hypothetical protein